MGTYKTENVKKILASATELLRDPNQDSVSNEVCQILLDAIDYCINVIDAKETRINDLLEIIRVKDEMIDILKKAVE